MDPRHLLTAFPGLVEALRRAGQRGLPAGIPELRTRPIGPELGQGPMRSATPGGPRLAPSVGGSAPGAGGGIQSLLAAIAMDLLTDPRQHLEPGAMTAPPGFGSMQLRDSWSRGPQAPRPRMSTALSMEPLMGPAPSPALSMAPAGMENVGPNLGPQSGSGFGLGPQLGIGVGAGASLLGAPPSMTRSGFPRQPRHRNRTPMRRRGRSTR